MIHFRLMSQPPGDADRDLQRLLDHFRRAKRPFVEFSQAVWSPFADLFETPDMIVALVELAGVEPQDVEVIIENQALIVRGQRLNRSARDSQSYHLMEIKQGLFERVLPLPVRVDSERTQANFRDGLLEVRLPKTQVDTVAIRITLTESRGGSQA